MRPRVSLILALLAGAIPLHAGWSKAYQLTATGVAASSNQTNFPCMVSDSSGIFASVANGGYVQNYNATTNFPYDLVFSSSNSLSPYIPWEIESWNPTTGALVAWAQCATLYGTGASPTETSIYVAVGNSSINTQQNTGSYAGTNVWDSNYKLVIHLANGTTLAAFDSTGNCSAGSIDSGVIATAGEVDGAASFPNSGGNEIFAPSSCIPTTWSAFTLAMWTHCGNFSTNPSFPYGTVMFQTSQAGNGIQFLYGDLTSAHNGMLDLAFRGVATNTFTSLATTLNHTNFIAATLSGTTAIGYLWDLTGSTSATQTLTVGSPSAGNGVYLIGNGDTGSVLPYQGWIDEVELSATVRSADWLKEEYTNQSNPGSSAAAGFWTWTPIALPNNGSQLFVIVVN